MSDREHQNWLKIDGGTAWHLIERHSESWQQTNEMMNECINAHVQAATKAQEARIKELEEMVRVKDEALRGMMLRTDHKNFVRDYAFASIKADQALAISKEVKA